MRHGAPLLYARPSGDDPPVVGGGVTFVSSRVGSGVFGTTSMSVEVPPSVQEGDLLMIAVNGAQGLVTPSGWTQRAAIGADFFCLSRFADIEDVALSASSGTWTFTTTDANVTTRSAVAYRGVSLTSPFTAGPTATSGATLVPTLPAQTGSGVYVGLMFHPNNGGTAPTWPPELTLRAESTTPNGQQRTAWLDTTISGSGGPYSGTQQSAFTWGAVSMILQAA